MFKLRKDSEKGNNQKKTKAKVAAWRVTPSCTIQHGAGEHGCRLRRYRKGLDLKGFYGGIVGSSLVHTPS